MGHSGGTETVSLTPKAKSYPLRHCHLHGSLIEWKHKHPPRCFIFICQCMCQTGNKCMTGREYTISVPKHTSPSNTPSNHELTLFDVNPTNPTRYILPLFSYLDFFTSWFLSIISPGRARTCTFQSHNLCLLWEQGETLEAYRTVFDWHTNPFFKLGVCFKLSLTHTLWSLSNEEKKETTANRMEWKKKKKKIFWRWVH